jgi:hypothetical protein
MPIVNVICAVVRTQQFQKTGSIIDIYATARSLPVGGGRFVGWCEKPSGMPVKMIGITKNAPIRGMGAPCR